MPKIDHAGFSSTLCFPLDYTHAQSSATTWQRAVELGDAHAGQPHSGGIYCTFTKLPAPNHPLRVYFSRDRVVSDLATTVSVYAAYLTVSEPAATPIAATATTATGTPRTRPPHPPPVFYKCFAIGPGVVDNPASPWFLDSHFGSTPRDLHALRHSYVELRVCRATAKPGISYGDGLLDPDQIHEIDQTDVAVCFRWYVATEPQLGLLGLDVSRARATAEAATTVNRSETTTTTTATATRGSMGRGREPNEARLEVVRESNRKLVGLLLSAGGQKRQVLESIVASSREGREDFAGSSGASEGRQARGGGEERLSELAKGPVEEGGGERGGRAQPRRRSLRNKG